MTISGNFGQRPDDTVFGRRAVVLLALSLAMFNHACADEPQRQDPVGSGDTDDSSPDDVRVDDVGVDDVRVDDITDLSTAEDADASLCDVSRDATMLARDTPEDQTETGLTVPASTPISEDGLEAYFPLDQDWADLSINGHILQPNQPGGFASAPYVRGLDNYAYGPTGLGEGMGAIGAGFTSVSTDRGVTMEGWVLLPTVASAGRRGPPSGELFEVWWT